ncbi:MAG TPA: hypothetical protein VMC08_06050 [Bacteroidales bacterium]|nr:hypothetical protein [Bacteroidales bacterium]
MCGRIILFLIIALIPILAKPAGEVRVIGAGAASMGYCSVALTDNWSGFNNQAGLAWQTHFSAGVGYENRFLLKELGNKAAGAVLPFRGGTFALTLQQFGFSLYNELKTGIAFGRSFGRHFAAGVHLYYLRIHLAEDYGTRNLVSFEIGFQYRPDEQWTVGIHFSNPVPVKVNRYQDEHLPVVIRLGLAYRPSSKFLVTVEAEKDLARKPVIRAGAEYHFAKPAFLRIGVMTNPVEFSFGVGLEPGKFRIEIASTYHLYLGYSPQFSLAYLFK